VKRFFASGLSVLRKNHSGMETTLPLTASGSTLYRLRKNHSGMETEFVFGIIEVTEGVA